MWKHLPNWLRTEDWVMGGFRSQDDVVVVVVVVELLLFCWEVNWSKPGDFNWSKIWDPVEFANLEDPSSPKPEQRTADYQKTRRKKKKEQKNRVKDLINHLKIIIRSESTAAIWQQLKPLQP